MSIQSKALDPAHAQSEQQTLETIDLLLDAAKKGKSTQFRRAHKILVQSLAVGSWPYSALNELIQSKNPKDRQEMVALLMSSERAPVAQAGKKSYYLDAAIDHKAFECVRALHNAGHILNNPTFSGLAIADAMGRGIWPHPDLVCPDLLKHKEMREAFFVSFEKSAYHLADYNEWGGALRLRHIERIAKLPRDMDFTRQFTKVWARIGNALNGPAKPMPEHALRAAGLSRIIELGLIDEQHLRQNWPGMVKLRGLLDEAEAFGQRKHLEKETPMVATAPRARAPRL